MEVTTVTICLETLFDILTDFDNEIEYVKTEYGYIQKETDEDKK